MLTFYRSPAAWGPNTRLNQRSDCQLDSYDFSRVHPACCSDSVVFPLEIANCEDIDILNVQSQEDELELERLEAINFIRLAKLKVSMH